MPLFIVYALILSLFSGCSSTSPAVSEYTIHPSYSSSESTTAAAYPTTLKIVTLETLSSLNSKSVRYTQPNDETGGYLYGRWSDTPSVMLTRLLVSSLERQNLFSVLMTASSNAKADWVLESELMAFEHRFNRDGTSQGLIDISCRVIDVKTKQPISAKRFVILNDAPSNDIQGGIIALQKSSDELIAQQSSWLFTIIKNTNK